MGWEPGLLKQGQCGDTTLHSESKREHAVRAALPPALLLGQPRGSRVAGGWRGCDHENTLCEMIRRHCLNTPLLVKDIKYTVW